MSIYKKINKRTRRNQFRLLVAAVLLVIAAGLANTAYQVKTNPRYKSSGKVTGSRQTVDEITYNGYTYVLNDHISNYLILGIDRSIVESDVVHPGQSGQADFLLLVSYNRMTKESKFIAIPRDTMAEVETFSLEGDSQGFTREQIALQYAFGDGRDTSCQLTAKSASKLLGGINIIGYQAASLEVVPAMVEAIGQVDVTLPDDSLIEVNPAWTKGATVTITPENAEKFVRTRNSGDYASAEVRMERQKAFIMAYGNRIRQMKDSTEDFVKVYEKISDLTVTNMTSDIFLKLSQAKVSDEGIVTLPGRVEQGNIYEEYHVDGDALQKLIIDTFYVSKE